MGYEVKLLIGTMPLHKEKEFVYGDSKTEDGHREMFLSGRYQTWFSKIAEIDLCKPGYDSSIYELVENSKNTDEDHDYYFFSEDGNTRVKQDRYDERFIPVPLEVVVSALKEDVLVDGYRRFKWALSLLESMQDEIEDFFVMFYGH